MTKKHPIIFMAALVIFISNWLFLNQLESHASSDELYPISRHIQYGFTIQNRTNTLIKDAEFLAYAPVKQTAIQHSVRLTASYPYKLIIDDRGNQVLHFRFHEFPPFATKIVTIEADLRLSNTPNSRPEKDLQAYLREEKFCESDDPEISELAAKLKGKNAVHTAKNIFNWISAHLQYAGYIKNVHGARHALRTGTGDCTEYMYLFVALCRAAGIPARGIGGFTGKENRVLNPGEYHNWAEFYERGVWRMVDPQKRIFMQNPSHYVATHIMGGLTKHPMGDYHRFHLKGEGLKVSGGRK